MKMSLTSSKDDKEIVRVVCDFTYTPKDASDPVSISVGEEYRLLDKTNTEWWYVQKNRSKARFFIPAKYVEILRKGGRSEENNTLTNGNPIITRPKPHAERIMSLVPTAKDETKPRSMAKSCHESTVFAGRPSGRVEKISMKLPGGKRDNDVDDKLGGSRAERASEEKPARPNAPESVDPANATMTSSQTMTSPQTMTSSQMMTSSQVETARRSEMHVEASSAVTSGADFRGVRAGHVAPDNRQRDRVAAATVSTDDREESDVADGIGTKDDADKPTKPLTSKPELSSKMGKEVGVGMTSSEYENIDDLRKLTQLSQSRLRDVNNGKPEKSAEFKVPFGWTVEEEEGEKTFVNNSNGQKWKTAFDETGRQYFYSLLTNQTVWTLSEVCTLAPRRKVVSLYKSSSARQPLTESSKPSSFRSGVKHTAWPSSRHVVKHLGQARALEVKASESSKGSHGVESRRIDPDFDKEDSHLEPLPLKMVQKQGPLSKAKVDDQGKKAKKPSWSQSYTVLVENILYFYKDMKVAASAKAKSISSLGKPEVTLQLDNAKLSSSPDEKRKEVLTLSLSNGVVYLLHHEDEEVLQHWRQSFENNIEAIKTTPTTTTTSSSKEIETFSVRPELSRMCSNSSIISEERLKIADRLLHWFKRRPSLEVLQLKGIIKDAVFGSSLTAICEREKTKIPRFVHACLAAVEKRGLDVDGIYRISGNMSLVQKLRHTVDQNEFYDLLCSTWDVHTITGALKLFFRELSEPVFTFALFDKFLDAYRIADHGQKISAYRDVISRLPPCHKETMKKLFKHLTEVIRHGSANRMQSQALAIVFGPTLLWPESKSKDVTLAASMVYQGQVVEFMINDFKSIFS